MTGLIAEDEEEAEDEAADGWDGEVFVFRRDSTCHPGYGGGEEEACEELVWVHRISCWLDFGKGWKGVCAGEFGHEEEGEDAVFFLLGGCEI